MLESDTHAVRIDQTQSEIQWKILSIIIKWLHFTRILKETTTVFPHFFHSNFIVRNKFAPFCSLCAYAFVSQNIHCLVQ